MTYVKQTDEKTEAIRAFLQKLKEARGGKIMDSPSNHGQ